MSDRPIHDRMEEMLSAEAMGGQDEDGRRELRGAMTWHDPRCPECAGFRVAYAEVAASLAMSLEPVPPAAGAERRLLEAVRASARGGPALTVTRLDDEDDERAGAGRRRNPLRVAAAALAAAACLFAAGVLGYAVRGPTASPTAVARLFAAQPGTRSATLQSGAQRVVVYYRPGQQAALLVGTGLPSPPAGHVYELWLITPGGKADPAGVFVPDASGGKVVVIGQSLAGYNLMAVTVEAGPDGVGSPTQQPQIYGTVA